MTFTLLIAMGPLQAGPAEWMESDWVKFVDAAVAGAAGEALSNAGSAIPPADVYSGLSAVRGSTKAGLQPHLRKKMANTQSAGDDDRFDRYSAFYTCLTWQECDDLRKMQMGSSTGSPPPLAPPSGVMVDSLIIPNTRPEKVRTTIVLEQGRTYRIRARGVVSNWSNHDDGVDAVWCYGEWRCGANGIVWDQLRIDGQGMTELAGRTIPYNPTHVYETEVPGQEGRLERWMSDAHGSSSDNSGEIYVDIYR